VGEVLTLLFEAAVDAVGAFQLGEQLIDGWFRWHTRTSNRSQYKVLSRSSAFTFKSRICNSCFSRSRVMAGLGFHGMGRRLVCAHPVRQGISEVS
jgi:hypothetical protein